MPAADIEVNGVAGSDDDVPINVLVQLSNADVGGEVTYLWEISDQPEGAADVLSSTAIENPTFTPKKEGSYRLRLTVNDTLASEVSGTAVVAVRHLKTNERIPAATESTEVDAAKGWKPAVNRLLAIVDDVARDANIVACVVPGAGFPTTGDIVRFTGVSIIKIGLPGEERLLFVETALATTAANVTGPLGVVVGTPTGGAPSANGIVLVRKYGLVEVSEAGAPLVGDPVYVSDTAQPALVGGTVSRKVGKVVEVGGGAWRWMIDSAESGAVVGTANQIVGEGTATSPLSLSPTLILPGTLETNNVHITGDNDNDGYIKIGGDLEHLATGNVGFYGTAPIAKQVGVAVTAAGIHAALVALGLIGP